ncbi:hypothetical protein [Tunturiibacter gelidiferens]|uniref:hypothetical protein n=1 Tax=Tunturiibacter gelidiferens TaxID=3069689 RepID=UPI003D9B8649
MEDKDWINAATQVQGLVMTLWTVYVAIVGATLAFVTSGRIMLQRPHVRLLVIAAYWIASSVNLWAMLNLRKQHDLMAFSIKDSSLSTLKHYMLRPKPRVYIAIHLGVDIGMTVVAWNLPRFPA